MWRRRFSLLTVLVMVAMLGVVTPGTAMAGRQGDPIEGDFNADGIMDVATLGTVQPGRCSIVVRYGNRQGGFGPPSAHIFLRPGGNVIGVCPDIGVAFDWDRIPGDEVWVGFSHGQPPFINYNRIVLKAPQFQIVATYLAPITPEFMGLADFTGDGRVTPYTWGRGGFASYASGPTGGAARGPVQWCSMLSPLSVHVRDFDRDGAAEALIAYAEGCADQANGVVVVLDDGSVRQLEFSANRRRAWTAQVVYANDDRFPDVRTVDYDTGEVSHFINAGGAFVRSPYAEADAVYPTTPGRIVIDVLANDFASNQTRVVIVSQPQYGTAQVLPDRRIAYTPTTTPTRPDRFVYRLLEGGRQSTTSVYIRPRS